jgi:hypothetical protein
MKKVMEEQFIKTKQNIDRIPEKQCKQCHHLRKHHQTPEKVPNTERYRKLRSIKSLCQVCKKSCSGVMVRDWK